MSEAIQQLLAEGVSAHPLGDDQVIVVVDRRGVVFDRADLEFLLTALRKCPEESAPTPVRMPTIATPAGVTTRSDAPRRAPMGALGKAKLVSAARKDRAKAEVSTEAQGTPEKADRDWAAIEQVARSLGVNAAAVRFGVPYHTVYSRAKKEGWPLPDGNKTRGRAIQVEGAGVVEGMRRRCHECEQMTTANPCAHCQAAA